MFASNAVGESRSVVTPPLLVSVQSAARILAVGSTTVYELIAAGELESIHIGKSRRVPLAALQAFVQQRRG
jgi:excisionase family DNA binding protein